MQRGVDSHQNRVIKKTLEYISKTRNVVCKIIDYPDEKERRLPACDVFAIIDSKKVAVEHTSIDSIPFQRRDNKRFSDLLGPLEEQLTGKLPKQGNYQLVVDMDVIPIGVKWDFIRLQISEWCQKVASSLAIGNASTAPKHFIREKLLGVPFEVTLYRWPFRDGQFRVARFLPADLENKRTKVIIQSLISRGIKVSKYKDDGFRTLLILESNDIILANASDIGKAFIKAISCARLNKFPDEVYLVETEMEPYYFYCLKIDDALFPESNKKLTEF
jgi:hypothetical protein